MLIEIPDAWRQKVADILLRGFGTSAIILKGRPEEEWQALTLNPFKTSLYDALRAVLRRPGPLKGRVGPKMKEPGEIYEFAFNYDADHGTVQVYTKLNLTPSGKVVIIYSAHRPNFEDELTNELI